MFSRRIKNRLQLWWEIPVDIYKPANFIGLITRYYQTHCRRFESDPAEKWHRGKYWQRRLTNKWNARQFAIKHCCPVPKLYWFGRFVGSMKIDTLPDHFVVKPALGYSRRGVYVISKDLDLMSGQTFSAKILLNHIKKTHGSICLIPLLVEEFVRSEDGCYRLPAEYKCHVFGSEVAAIQVISRKSSSQKDAEHMFYTPTWDYIQNQMNMEYKFGSLSEPPKCLDEMLFWAKKLGKAYGTYVRTDFYASDRGCVFGEFSTTPHHGDGYTDFADNYFEYFWQKNLGDAI